MTSHRWRQIREVFDAVQGEAIELRAALIDEKCAGDAELRREVESLLAHRDRSGGFLEAAPSALAQEDRRIASGTRYSAMGAVSIGEQIGAYRLVRVLGSGGMGVVYLAEQENPRRHVALKVLRPGLLSADAVRRFEYEAQILARLKHPGIAQIIEAGTAPHGQPFFAMEYVDGVTLVDFAIEQRLGTRERLALFIRVCEAVQHAHQRGVVHRDLKPGNILVVTEGAQDATHAASSAAPPSGGSILRASPKILDFGIARVTDADRCATSLHTGVGQLLGTMSYMSPEQLVGDPQAIDTRCDVYSLGVILFELLTGRLPHDVAHRSAPDAMRAITSEEPARLGSVNRDLRGDLETIVAKALETDRDRRYGSAAALASDIERFMEDEPILARPTSTWYQLRKFARRNRGLVGGVFAVFMALAAGAIGMTWQAVVATRAKASAQQSAARFELLYRFFAGMLASSSLPGATDGSASDELPPGRQVRLADLLDRGAADVAAKLAGQENVETVVRHTLGRAYFSLRLFPEAEAQWQRAAELYRRLSGPDDRATLTAESNLVLLYRSWGRLNEAEQACRHTLAAQQRTLGRDHPDTFVTLVDLLTTLERSQKMDSAREILEEAIRVAPLALRIDSRDAVLDSADAVLLFLLESDRNDAALALSDATRAAVRASSQATEVRRALVQFRHAVCLERLRRFEEAERELLAVLGTYQRLYGPTHQRTLEVREGVACLYDAWKKPEKAATFRPASQQGDPD